MDDKGHIHELSGSDHEKMLKERMERLNLRQRQIMTPITEREAA